MTTTHQQMSVSKLESLPNEILIDIFEKYLDGMDIINAFAFQLNRRFDAIVAQCRRVRFNFIRCHKDDFRCCIGLLPRYIDKIEELALSEQKTPGQIHAFLSFYPSFATFKQLRSLYFHINIRTVDPKLAWNALQSLSESQLHTLSIKITEISDFDGLNSIITDIFHMKTLKKLILACDISNMRWRSLDMGSSNIERLTIRNMSCLYEDLRYIFRCASGLKYLDIDIYGDILPRHHHSTPFSNKCLTQLPMLRTAVFNIYANDSTTHRQLKPFLRCMPSLHRLEIKAYGQLHKLSEWKRLLQTSLPSLVSFTFEMNMSSLTYYEMSAIIRSIETPFWIKKENFNFILKWASLLHVQEYLFFESSASDLYSLNGPIAHWWIVPPRRLDNPSISNRISMLELSIESLVCLQNSCLENVTHLLITEWNDDLFESIIKHIDCSRIKHLDVSDIEEENDKISSLLLYTTNITSLRIHLFQLSDPLFTYVKNCSGITCLDISAGQHPFHTENLSVIGNMFPNLEHLIINTRELSNVPKLQTYLPRLRSLTFRGFGIQQSRFTDDYEEQSFYYTLRKKAKFLFQRESDYITVWIDQAALQDPYWRRRNARNIIINNHSTRSTQQSWPAKIMTTIFSCCRR